jgi:probable phosphoglycerate mutase
LNAAGRAQTAGLAARLAALPISAIYSSPLERAMETAEPLACRLGLTAVPAAGLNEVDFGDWTGRSLAELDRTAEWRVFNERRQSTRIPNGETMQEVLTRASHQLEQLRLSHAGAGQLVAAVSHGDVIRSILVHSLGVSLDLMHRIEVAPASVSVLAFRGAVPRVLLLNSTEGWPEEVVSPGG